MLDLRGEEDEEGMGKYIGKIARHRGMGLKTLKKMAQDRDQYRKWINTPTLKGNNGKRSKSRFKF